MLMSATGRSCSTARLVDEILFRASRGALLSYTAFFSMDYFFTLSNASLARSEEKVCPFSHCLPSTAPTPLSVPTVPSHGKADSPWPFSFRNWR
jgi:hypothetical protein